MKSSTCLSVLVSLLLAAGAAEGQPAPMQEGWPIPGWNLPPVLADVTGDDTPEVVALQDSMLLQVWTADGTLLSDLGWPGFYPEVIRVGDMTGDGVAEIVAAAVDSQPWIGVFDLQGNELPGWPVVGQDLYQHDFRVLMLADVNGDGAQEIVYTYYYGLSWDNPFLTIRDGSGQELPGWPQQIDHPLSSVAVADLEFDGRWEIVLGTHSHEIWNGPSPLYCFEHDGSQREGFPVIPGGNNAGHRVSVADLDGNGRCELICTDQIWITILRDTGALFRAPAPVGSVLRNIAIGDVDADGRKEIINVSTGSTEVVTVYDYDAGIEAEMTYPGYRTFASQVLGDVDGDGDLEIAFAALNTPSPQTTRAVFLTDHMLNPLPGFPIDLDLPQILYYSISLVDVDLDGDLELIYNDNGDNIALDLPNASAVPSVAPWRMLWQGPGGTKNYHADLVLPRFVRGDANRDGRVDVADVLTMFQWLFFGGGVTTDCPRQLDADGNEAVEIGDALLLIVHLFMGGGTPPPNPFPWCGTVYESALPCEDYDCP